MRLTARVLAIVAANLAVALVLLEIALRVQEPFLHLMSLNDESSPNYRFAVIDHPVWDHQLRPGLHDFWLRVSGHEGEASFAYPLRTNTWGCRGGEIVVPKPRDVYRVLVIGDSFTEGYAEEDTVSSQLEQALAQTRAPVRFEVMNCAVSSYSLLPILLRLRDQLLATQPDAVIVNVDLTDPYDDYWRRRPDLRVDASGRLLGVGRPDAGESAGDVLASHSYAVRALSAYGRLAQKLVKHTLRERFGGGDTGAAAALDTLADRYRMHGTSPEAAQEFGAAWTFFVEQVDRVIALCQESRVVCAFSTYPHEGQLAKAGEAPALHREFQGRLAAYLADQGMPYHDAYPAIAAAYARDPSIYRRGDMHFSPAGQRVWGQDFARAFAPWLLAQAAGAAVAHQQMPE